MVPVETDISVLFQGKVDVWPGHVGDEDYTLDRDSADYSAISPSQLWSEPFGDRLFYGSTNGLRAPDLVRHFLTGLSRGWDLAYRNYTTALPMIASFHKKRPTADYVRFALDRQREYLRPMALRYGEFNEQQWRTL